MRNKVMNLWKRVLSAALIAVMALALNVVPARAASLIESVEYNGNGRIEVDFRTDVTYPALKVVVRDSAGKKLAVRISRKDDDELHLIVKGLKSGKNYTVKVSGIRKRGSQKNVSATGKVSLPYWKGCVAVKKIESDYEDKEVEFEFTSLVQYKNPKITVSRGGRVYAKKIVDRGRNSIEVYGKGLKKGVKYTYTITGIRRKGANKYGSVKGTFIF